MRLLKYNESQIKELKRNKYVKSVTSKNINFTLECKLEIIKLSNKWIFYKEIFRKLWFPEYVINSEIPRNLVNRLKNNLKKWKIEDKRWRPKVEKIDYDNMTLEQENEYLRAKVAYLEEINSYINSWPTENNKVWKDI